MGIGLESSAGALRMMAWSKTRNKLVVGRPNPKLTGGLPWQPKGAMAMSMIVNLNKTMVLNLEENQQRKALMPPRSMVCGTNS